MPMITARNWGLRTESRGLTHLGESSDRPALGAGRYDDLFTCGVAQTPWLSDLSVLARGIPQMLEPCFQRGFGARSIQDTSHHRGELGLDFCIGSQRRRQVVHGDC